MPRTIAVTCLTAIALLMATGSLFAAGTDEGAASTGTAGGAS